MTIQKPDQKTSGFECFRFSDGWISDPHCIWLLHKMWLWYNGTFWNPDKMSGFWMVHLKSEPFGNWTCFNQTKTRLVLFSNAYIVNFLNSQHQGASEGGDHSKCKLKRVKKYRNDYLKSCWITLINYTLFIYLFIDAQTKWNIQ